jgi:hypothetical protein
MPTQQFAIERNGPKRIEVSWKGMWNEFTVKFDGAVAGSATKDELNAGKELTLSDGSTFKVHLRKAGMSTELALLRNGVPLPGSAADPVTLSKTAAGIVYFIAALNVLVGVIAMAGQVEILLQAGFGIGSIVVGVLFGVLGFFTMQRSRIALGIAMAIYGLDGLASLAMGVVAGGRPGVGGIVMHVVLLMAMWRGFKAMGALKEQTAQAPSITSG